MREGVELTEGRGRLFRVELQANQRVVDALEYVHEGKALRVRLRCENAKLLLENRIEVPSRRWESVEVLLVEALLGGEAVEGEVVELGGEKFACGRCIREFNRSGGLGQRV